MFHARLQGLLSRPKGMLSRSASRGRTFGVRASIGSRAD